MLFRLSLPILCTLFIIVPIVGHSTINIFVVVVEQSVENSSQNTVICNCSLCMVTVCMLLCRFHTYSISYFANDAINKSKCGCVAIKSKINWRRTCFRFDILLLINKNNIRFAQVKFIFLPREKRWYMKPVISEHFDIISNLLSTLFYGFRLIRSNWVLLHLESKILL